MEAVPRMPMLFFDLKTTSDSVDFKVLKEYIQHAYHENPESYSLEIHSLEALRAKAAHPQHNVEGVNILKKYFCQLTFLKSRFPITREGPIRITFTWKEAFSSNVGTSHDVRFEQLCVMFNIGSLHSKLGVMDERVTSEGLKLACSHFQCAAWAFQQLKEMNCPDIQMSSSLISFLVNTCLAQAQECVLEQSLTGNRKSIINAKVAAQIVEFYTIALNALSAISPEQLKYETNCCEVFDVKTHEGWKKYLRCKIHYYKAITLLYQGMQAEDEQNMGERVTYYDAAFDKLTESMNESKAIAKSDITRNLHDLAMMPEAFSFTMDVIEGKRKAARNDNEYVYHCKVPPLDSLPELRGRDLVKCVPFSPNDTDISGTDIFEKLIPMKAHEAASLYSEEKAKLLRHMSAKVETLNAELAKFMGSILLDIETSHTDERLPQDLVDKCAEMTARPDAIQEITNAMAQLSDSYHDVDAMLEEIKALVTEEEENEKEYQEIMGPRPPSIVATDLKREMNKYLEAHRKGQESNETLHQVMSFHVANLKLLSLTPAELEKHIPPLTQIKTPETKKSKEVLDHLVSKVKEMQQQRDTLCAQLREDLHKDEITSQLVTRQTDCLETVFESALAKHNIVINLIEKNLQAQPRILTALTSAYSTCAPLYTTLDEVIQRRNSVLAALRSSYDAYEDLRNKTKRGIEFYEKLGNSVSKLLTRVKGTCKVQDEERLSLLKKENKVLPRHRKKAAERAAAKVPPPEDSPLPVSQSTGPKLKDYLAAAGGYSKNPGSGSHRSSVYPSDYPYPSVPAGVRPTPVGSEMNVDVIPDSTLGYNYPADASQSSVYSGEYSAQTSGHSQDKTGGYGGSQYTGNYQTMGMSHPVNYGTLPNPAGYSTANTVSNPANTSSNLSGYSNANSVANSAGYTSSNPSGYSTANTVSNPANISSNLSGYSNANSVSNSAGYTSSNPSGYSTANTAFNPSGYPTDSMVSNPASYSTPNTASNPSGYSTANTVSNPAGYSTPNTASNPSGYSNANSVSNPAGYSTPNTASNPSGYSTANTVSTPAGYSTANTAPTAYTGSNPHGPITHQQPIPETHPSLQQPTSAYPQHYGNHYHSSQTQPPDQYSATSSANHASYPNYYSPDTQYNANGTGKYNAPPTPYPTQQTPQALQQPNSMYPYPTSTTPVTNPTYVHTSSEPTPYAMPYPNTVSPAPQYGYQYPTGSGQYDTTQNNSAYPSAYSYDQNNHQYANMSNNSQYQYENPTSKPQHPYGNSAIPQSQYGNSATHPSQYVNPTLAIAEQQNIPMSHSTYGQSYNPTQDTNATGTLSQQSMPVSYSTYGQTYNPTQDTNTLPTQQSIPVSHSMYGTTNNPTQDTNTPGTLPSQQNSHYATSEPLTFSPYTPELKYPGGSPSYSYNSAYSNAGHPSYLQTQSSAYSPHERASSAHNYYNVPYGTQSYIQANGNSYVNTTPSTLMSPEPRTPHVLSPTPSLHNKPSGLMSNVDLLADLDVNVTQSPLVPSSDFSLSGQLSNLSVTSGVSTSQAQVSMAQPPAVDTKTSSEDLSAVLSSISLTAPKPVAPGTDITLDKELLTLLAQDAEHLEKTVESLSTRTLSGPGSTPLDSKWKELNDLQAKDACSQSISVARCYPMKNRSPDILPYDSTRVELPSTKDDYINASYIRCPVVSSAPPLIVTQAPVTATVADFWTMVWEKNVELVVCLLTDTELDTPVYWPSERGQDLEVAKLRISLQSRNLRGSWTERILSLQDQDRKLTHFVVHLQLSAWPGSSFPSSPAQFVSLVSEAVTLYNQQRSLSHHVVVHCSAGIGRSGLFCLVLLALVHINAGKGIPDLVQLAATISGCRKNLLRDREHLKFAHQSVLYYAQDLLIKRGVLSRTSFEEKRPKSHSRIPSQDFLHSGVGGSSVDYTALEDSSCSKKGHSRKSSSSSICSSSNKADVFSSQVGALDKLSTLSTPHDPLSQIDPLWPMKKEKDASTH